MNLKLTVTLICAAALASYSHTFAQEEHAAKTDPMALQILEVSKRMSRNFYRS